MNKIIFTLVLVIIAGAIFAQPYNMKIEQGTHSTIALTTSIDKITFLDHTIPFNCGDAILNGGDLYPTVQIGTQCWFQKNLNIGTRINGTTNQTDNGILEKYCYDDIDATCTTYGALYQWNEVMGYVTTSGAQGICPIGWHIPTGAELQTLISTVGASSNALKAMGQGSGAGAGTNTSGFSALLAGYRERSDGSFFGLGIPAYFWSSTESSVGRATHIELWGISDNVNFSNYYMDMGFSVRCLKD